MRDRTDEEILALAKATGTSYAYTLRVLGRKTPQPWAAAEFAERINEPAPLKPLGKGHNITFEEEPRMTPRQRDCFEFIKAYWKDHGCSPSYEDIMAGLGISGKSRVFDLVSVLQRRGMIAREYGMPRSIRILGECPCCGRRG